MIAVPGGDVGGWREGCGRRAAGGGRRAPGGESAPGPGRVQGEGGGVWRLRPAALTGSRTLGLGSDSGSAPLGLRRSHSSRGHPHPRLTDVPGTHRSRGVRGQGAPSFLLLWVKPGTAAPSPRAETASAALSDAPRPGSREIRGEPGDTRPRGARGCAAPAPTGLFREDANPTCPREVLGSWMGKSLLSPAPRLRAF
ncbi:collagen alpha-2(VI) chain-like [Sapajus apella]|uniref:Collagen alpha-2(VI) chain-like n=1 Tax=Sapajus apella TaxID=9515 RepID=A0A6J3F319_SAPAP|nr:collagen alpha-2(VI) chain-like [Sapajus apella]